MERRGETCAKRRVALAGPRAHLKKVARRTVSQKGTTTFRPTMAMNADVRLEKRDIPQASLDARRGVPTSDVDIRVDDEQRGSCNS